MRYLIISDIHSNFPALQSVLMDAPVFDAVCCLGDVVGYGPDPNRCIERLDDLSTTCVAGNHDWGVLSRVDLHVFNADARQALLWSRGAVAEENYTFLAELTTLERVEDDYLLVHGSPMEPIWEYLVDVRRARKSFLAADFQVAFVGHTHIPVVFEWLEEDDDAELLFPDREQPLQLNGRRLIINPGSVGQPRDGDRRAAYGLLDTEAQTFEFHRVTYPIEITQERMRARGLPHRLIDRLDLGR
jgi:diadenosine tetraphosphatase ApaH/serine/threonine PP2A family protein phosphatase